MAQTQTWKQTLPVQCRITHKTRDSQRNVWIICGTNHDICSAAISRQQNKVSTLPSWPLLFVLHLRTHLAHPLKSYHHLVAIQCPKHKYHNWQKLKINKETLSFLFSCETCFQLRLQFVRGKSCRLKDKAVFVHCFEQSKSCLSLEFLKTWHS